MSDETAVLTDEEVKAHRDAIRYAILYAQSQRQALLDLTSNRTSSVTYTRFTKEQILSYIQSPKSNERNLRNASIYMHDASSQYRRLIQYYAYMPLWAYTLAPLGFDPASYKSDVFLKAYTKAAKELEIMNLKHEMPKAAYVAMREGVFYGVQWKSKDCFFIQRINPDICKLSSFDDGVWYYAVDFSKIKTEDLILYHPEFEKLKRTSEAQGASKWQEIPDGISFCIKADETTPAYSIPPWSSTLPMLYDIETFKALQETATEISNYKLIGLEIPVDEDGVPKIDYGLAEKYYTQLISNLPPYVGAAMSPMKMSAVDFQKGAGTNDVDTVSRAEEQFWREGGTSPLLFGSADNDTAGALKLSIKSDEEIVFNLMAQCERHINHILKSLSGSQKFKMSFLPVTVYNQDDWIDHYKEAATLGIPVKERYAAALGMSPMDILGMNHVEMDILKMGELTPLASSYTQAKSTGRPLKDDTELTETGQGTRDNDDNGNR